jgi:hypothetical protein
MDRDRSELSAQLAAELKGWRACTNDERKQFETRWPIGTTPRLVYMLALWLGHRRSEVAALPVMATRGDTTALTEIKIRREMRLSMAPILREALDAADPKSPTILLTAYREPFSAKSLTGRMADWTKSTGLPKGCTLHGVRKTLGGMLADGGARPARLRIRSVTSTLSSRRSWRTRSASPAQSCRRARTFTRSAKSGAANRLASHLGEPPTNPLICASFGVPEGIRTPDLRFRKPLLYPAELPGRTKIHVA